MARARMGAVGATAATMMVLALAGATPAAARDGRHPLFGGRGLFGGHVVLGGHRGHPINAWMGSRRVRLR